MHHFVIYSMDNKVNEYGFIVRTPPCFRKGINFPENGLKGKSKNLVFKGGGVPKRGFKSKGGFRHLPELAPFCT